MALKLVDTGRDSALIESSGVASYRNWGTWKTDVPPWASVMEKGEELRVEGRFRLEVLSSEILTYVNGPRLGTLGRGVYILDGTVRMFIQSPNASAQAVLTRLA